MERTSIVGWVSLILAMVPAVWFGTTHSMPRYDEYGALAGIQVVMEYAEWIPSEPVAILLLLPASLWAIRLVLYMTMSGLVARPL